MVLAIYLFQINKQFSFNPFLFLFIKVTTIMNLFLAITHCKFIHYSFTFHKLQMRYPFMANSK